MHLSYVNNIKQKYSGRKHQKSIYMYMYFLKTKIKYTLIEALATGAEKAAQHSNLRDLNSTT